MRVLIACEFSGVVRDAFIRAGHDAISCDLLPTESPGPHLQRDVLDVIPQMSWDLMIAHPPCTYLCNAGIRWLSGNEPRMKQMKEACDFFNAIKSANIPLIAIENPMPHHHAIGLIGRWQQKIQPFDFGHGETKATCLWLKGLPPLMATRLMQGRRPRVHFESPGPDRWKRRSRTYEGIAAAMANQWGQLAIA